MSALPSSTDIGAARLSSHFVAWSGRKQNVRSRAADLRKPTFGQPTAVRRGRPESHSRTPCLAHVWTPRWLVRPYGTTRRNSNEQRSSRLSSPETNQQPSRPSSDGHKVRIPAGCGGVGADAALGHQEVEWKVLGTGA